MKCSILRTDNADQQLREYIFYILENSDKNVALKHLQLIENKINQLIDFPESGSLPHYATLRKQGYRVLKVEALLVFYKYDKSTKTVTIYAITHNKQEYLKLL